MGGVIAWLARSKFPFNPRRRPNRLPLTRSQWSSHLASSSPYWATPGSLVRSAPRALSRRRSNPPATSTHATPCIVTARKQLIAKHTACPRLSKPANSEQRQSAQSSTRQHLPGSTYRALAVAVVARGGGENKTLISEKFLAAPARRRSSRCVPKRRFRCVGRVSIVRQHARVLGCFTADEWSNAADIIQLNLFACVGQPNDPIRWRGCVNVIDEVWSSDRRSSGD